MGHIMPRLNRCPRLKKYYKCQERVLMPLIGQIWTEPQNGNLKSGVVGEEVTHVPALFAGVHVFGNGTIPYLVFTVSPPETAAGAAPENRTDCLAPRSDRSSRNAV